MATAVLFGGRRLAGIIFTLLSLVHVANSVYRTAHLDILREYYEGGLEDAAEKKKECENWLKLQAHKFEDEMDEFTPKLKELKAAAQNSSSLDGLSSALTDLLVKKRKDFIEAKKAFEEEIQEIWDFIKVQEYGDD
ncbi:hypothetical protein CRENBAI_015044 [Crenichthys baileyi]|uniref:Uncharacterized protein n=1 Tax=Crenichthys baileyi TaxID=28760 RepID=A0AAV9R1R6_9TELE